MFLNHFKDKKILITGHTGFKGSWLTLFLKLAGAKIMGISLKPITKPSFFKAINLSKGIRNNYLNIDKISHLNMKYSTISYQKKIDHYLKTNLKLKLQYKIKCKYKLYLSKYSYF